MTAAERNNERIRRFQIAINTNDLALAEELIDEKAAFTTPVSPEKLYGAKGYLSVVDLMRKSFSDIRWDINETVADEHKVAVHWTCSGTHDGEFMGLPATGKKFAFGVMNFYYFNDDGKITNDIAAEGLIGLFRALGMAGRD